MSETTEARWERHNEAGCRYVGQGAYAEAEQEFTAAIREATALGSESLRLASSLGNLGQLKYRQRDFAGAEQLFRRSLAIRERVLGSDHYGVVQSVNNLAMLHYARGELDAAEPLFRRALELGDRHLGSDHPDVATALSNLARLHFRRGEYAAAAPLLARLLALKEAERGVSHPEVAAILASLAKVRLAERHFEAAEPLARRALAIRERTLGPDDSALVTTLQLLADICAAHGKHDEAGHLRDRARELRAPSSPDGTETASASASDAIAFIHGAEPIAPPVFERTTPEPPGGPTPPGQPPARSPRPPVESVLAVGAVARAEHTARRAERATPERVRHPSAAPTLPRDPHGVPPGPPRTGRSTPADTAGRTTRSHGGSVLVALITLGVVIALLAIGGWLVEGRPPVHAVVATLQRSMAGRTLVHDNDHSHR